MPIFDYRCNTCTSTFDVLHKGKEIADDIVCPDCGSRNASKLISLPAAPIHTASAPPCERGACRPEQSHACNGCCVH